MILRVFRWSPEANAERFDEFRVAPSKHTTVLDALVQVREREAPDLAFRYACRVGMCGSCAMVVDGRERWACRTRLVAVTRPTATVTVRPLYHFPLIRDLVVDMKPFVEKMRAALNRALTLVADSRDGGTAARWKALDPPPAPQGRPVTVSAGLTRLVALTPSDRRGSMWPRHTISPSVLCGRPASSLGGPSHG